jgi:hypothetical protein
VGTEATGRGACGKSTTMSNSPRLHAVEAVPPPHRKPLLCFSPLLDHLTQSCYPEDLQEALRPFDDAILTTAKHALGLDLADQIALRRARLPPSWSGLLLRQRGGHGGGFLPDAAFWGAVAQAIPSSLQIGPARLDSSRSSWTWVQAPLSRVGGGLRTSYISHAKGAAWQMSWRGRGVIPHWECPKTHPRTAAHIESPIRWAKYPVGNTPKSTAQRLWAQPQQRAQQRHRQLQQREPSCPNTPLPTGPP